jgi:hypothetical protein
LPLSAILETFRDLYQRLESTPGQANALQDADWSVDVEHEAKGG